MMKKIILSTLLLIVIIFICGCDVAEPDGMASAQNESDLSGISEQTELEEELDTEEEPLIEVSVSGSKVDATKEMLFSTSQVILRGVVEEAYPGKYTNPDGTLINKHGVKIANAWETMYRVRIIKVYKGEPYDDEEIIVKTWNWFAPDDAVADNIIHNTMDEYYLKEGQDMLLCLTYLEDNALNTDEFGYQIVYGHQGEFYTNVDESSAVPEGLAVTNGESAVTFKGIKFEFNEATLADEIAAIDNTETE